MNSNNTNQNNTQKPSTPQPTQGGELITHWVTDSVKKGTVTYKNNK